MQHNVTFLVSGLFALFKEEMQVLIVNNTLASSLADMGQLTSQNGKETNFLFGRRYAQCVTIDGTQTLQPPPWA